MTNPLRQAAQLVPGHWYQGGMEDAHGNRCGIGHLYAAIREEPQAPVSDLGLLLSAMNTAAHDKFPDRIGTWVENGVGAAGIMHPFAQFNDHAQTSEADVVAVMELAADRWDVEHG